MRVLVVDDESSSRFLVGSLMKRLGHEVLSANDGRHAWDILRNERPPLVATDWLMPNMSGVELCSAIRADPTTAATYVLIVTSLSSRESTLEGFRAGADDLLVKPVDVEQLRERVGAAQRVIRERDARAEAALKGALQASQAALGPEHPALLENLSNLTDAYRVRGVYSKARAFLRRQIGIAEKSKGVDHPEVVRLRSELDALTGRDDAA